MNYVLDTNIIIYLLKGQLKSPLPTPGSFSMSVISELEVLAYPDITLEEETQAQLLLKELDEIELTEDVKAQTIALCRKYRMKLPDAIIAATALVQDATLLTNDDRLRKISDLTCQTMEIL